MAKLGLWRTGCRIVLIADDTTSLGGSLTFALNGMNDYLYRLGSPGYLNSVDVGCVAPSDMTGPDILPHQITNGVAAVRMFCGSEIVPYNSYQLFISNQLVVGAVAKVDPTLQINYGG